MHFLGEYQIGNIEDNEGIQIIDFCFKRLGRMVIQHYNIRFK